MAIARWRYAISILSHRRLSTAATSSPPSPPPPSPVIAPPRKLISHLISSVFAESDPDKILALLHSSSPLPHFYDSPFLYQITVDKLARSRRPDLVERLLESQISHPAAPKSESFFIRIMSLYTHASMADHALQTFERIPSCTEQSVCALLTAYLKQRRYDRVRKLFDCVPAQHGIVPGVSTYNILLAALCKAGKVQNARKVLDEMFDSNKRLKPNILPYNTLLSAYLKKGDDAGFDDILKEVRRKEVGCNIITYNLMISNFCKRKESLKAEELLDTLFSNGVRPNHTTFSTVIAGFCKEGDLNAAVRVFDKMKKTENPKRKKKFSHSPYIYGVLLRCLVGKRDFTSALPICKEFLKMDFSPPFEVIKALVQGLMKDSKPEEARVLVKEMRKVASRCASDSWAKFESQLPL